MLSKQMIKGLKNYFKNEKLSDRRLQIIEIDEKFSCSGRKRKNTEFVGENNQKRARISVCEEENDEETLGVGITNSHGNKPLLANQISTDDDKENVEPVTPNNEKQQPETTCCSKESEESKKSPCVASHNTKILEATSLSEEILYSEFPVHSIVLCINSEYFQKLLVDSSMKETNLETVAIKVPYNEGKYLEMLIQAFYNEDILKSLKLTDLLQLLDIASRFSCTTFLEETLKLLNSKEIMSIDESDAILSHLAKVFRSNSSEKNYDNLKDACTLFLAKHFYPLELKCEEHETFYSLSYPSISYLLASKHSVTLMENHLFIFVYQWLLSNENYQTAHHIESLCLKINMQSLTTGFLHDELSISDKLLNIWPGYSQWFSNVLKYHLLSPSSRCLRAIKNIPLNIRTIPTNRVEMHVVRMFHFINGEFVDDFENDIVWAGTFITPRFLVKTDSSKYPIRLKFHTKNIFSPNLPNQTFYRHLEFAFAVIPGNMDFDMDLTGCKKFCQKYLRRAEVILKNKTSCSLNNVISLDEKSFSATQKEGLKLIMFFRTASHWSFGQYEWSNIKPSRKSIKIK